jgi:hypothetical protein
MEPLSAHNLLELWETGLYQHHLDRALTMLAFACPGQDRLASLKIAQRDSLLLDLREQMFGPELGGFAACPGCNEHMEFTMSVDDIRVEPGIPLKDEYVLEVEETKISFRLPDSRDLGVIACCTDIHSARNMLVELCVIRATRKGENVETRELQDEVIAILASSMSENGPQADIVLDLHCPACGHNWQVIFDIGNYLWKEISAQAKRILHEVHTLAQAYGWREEDILSMSPARRQLYLEMVT